MGAAEGELPVQQAEPGLAGATMRVRDHRRDLGAGEELGPQRMQVGRRRLGRLQALLAQALRRTQGGGGHWPRDPVPIDRKPQQPQMERFIGGEQALGDPRTRAERGPHRQHSLGLDVAAQQQPIAPPRDLFQADRLVGQIHAPFQPQPRLRSSLAPSILEAPRP
jgi:hypothetical protein